jgi:hypothetical protein
MNADRSARRASPSSRLTGKVAALTARLAAAALVVAGALLVLGGCQLSGPPSLDLASVHWASYESPSLGFALSYPDVYAPSASDDSYVPFRYGRFTPLIIRFVDEPEGRKRGDRKSVV